MTASDAGPVTRRQFVGGFGAGTVSVTGASRGARAAARPDLYDHVAVPEGETRIFELGDGDVLENTVVDITAPGATTLVYAAGREWTVRNVAIVGRHPDRRQPVLLAKDFGGGSVVENCYFHGDPSAPKATALFVHAEHSGDLLVRNCLFKHWTDNAVYASPPGNPDVDPYRPGDVGQGGTVRVENCYFEDVHVAGVRLGSDGSYARNCVFDGGPHRGFWGYYENTTYTNCHATATNPFDAGGLTYEKQSDAVVTLRDCCAEGDLRAQGGAEISGVPCRTPRTSPPSDVPLTALEAASGLAGRSGESPGDAVFPPPNGAGDASGRRLWPVAVVVSLLTGNPLVGLLLVLAVVAVLLARRRTGGSDRSDRSDRSD